MLGYWTIAGMALSSGGAGATTRPPSRLESLQVHERVFAGVPYVEIAVAHPKRTILYIHGGPDVRALDISEDVEGYLARRFRARIIKPVYYGSTERSPNNNMLQLAVTAAMGRPEIRRRVIGAVRETYRGMPQAVVEVRRFLRHWDAPSTVVLGESFGAPLAALAARVPHMGRLVLVAPVIATHREIVRAAIAGRSTLRDPIDPPRLVLEGRDRTDEILNTSLRRRRMLEAISLAYYQPWQNMTLGTMLKRTPGHVSIIVGLRDRVGMVTGREWSRLRAQAPRATRICLDPELAHTPPWIGGKGRRCFLRAMDSAKLS